MTIYTEDEIREKFLLHIFYLIDHWEKHRDNERKSLEGLAFSMLVLLDGYTTDLPGFKVIPAPHPNDKQWHLDRGEPYYPDDVDIAGELRDLFYPLMSEYEEE